MKTIIKNGAIVTASKTFEADVLVEDGVISAVGHGFSARDTIDASGLLVLPGAIDVHTHMEMLAGGLRSADDFYTGTVAAACGGTTTILDFVEAAPGQRLLDALADRMAQAVPKAVVDYSFHMTINRADAATIDEMGAIVCEGVPSFKAYMAYAGLMLDDEALYRVLVRSREVSYKQARGGRQGGPDLARPKPPVGNGGGGDESGHGPGAPCQSPALRSACLCRGIAGSHSGRPVSPMAGLC
jgi:dihydropyrimidinase